MSTGILGAASNTTSMSQLGRVVLIPNWNMKHERRSTDMNLYHLLRKAGMDLGSDTVPRDSREYTPVETLLGH